MVGVHAQNVATSLSCLKMQPFRPDGVGTPREIWSGTMKQKMT